MSRSRVQMVAGPSTLGRAVASVAGLLVVFVVVPVGLVAASRERFERANPLGGVRAPWTWTGDEVDAAVRRPIEDDSLIDLVLRSCLIVAWVAIVVIAITTVVETVHLVRHRGLPSPHRRGLGWAQGVARFLAMGIVALLPLASPVAAGERLSDASMLQGLQPAVPNEVAAEVGEGTSTAEPTVLSGHDDGSAVPAAPSDEYAVIDAAVRRTGEAAVHVVQRGDSVWAIAAALSNGSDADTLRLAEAILESNLGKVMNDGVVFENPALIQPGWELSVPTTSGATGRAESIDEEGDAGAPLDEEQEGASTYIVEPGDTLSSIAEEQLGGADRWTDLFDENRGAAMSDGRRLVDPDLIVPGWELDLPADVDSDRAADVDSDRAAGVDSDPPTDEADPAAEGDAPGPADTGPTTEREVPGEVESAAETELTEVTEPDPVTDRDADVGADAEPPRAVPAVNADDEPAWLDDQSGERVDTVSGVPDILDVERDGPTPESTVPGSHDAGRQAPAASTPASTTSSVPPQTDPAPASDVGGARPSAPAPLSIGHAALLAGGVITLLGVRRRRRLREALPRARVPEPPPSVAATERTLRNVDAGERAVRADVAVRAVARHVVDTGVQIGLVVVAGDGAVTVRLTGNASLPAPWVGAAARWELPGAVPVEMLADDARQSGAPCPALVHLGDDESGALVLLDLEAAGVTAIDAGDDQADGIVRSIAANLATSIHAETAHLIGVGLSPATFLDHPNAVVAADLDDAMHEATRRVGATMNLAASTFDLRTRRTGGEAWEPAVLLVAAHDGPPTIPGELLPDPGRGLAVVVARPAGTLPASAARLRARADGWLLHAFGATIELRPLGLTSGEVGQLVELLDDAAAPVVTEVREVVASSSPHEREVQPDGTGDADAAFEERAHEIVVKLLGEVSIHDPSGTAGSFERSKTVELVAWLATHPGRRTRTAARTALWEIDVRDATFANVVSEARRGLGRLVTPPDGEEWVARTLTDELPLHDLVVTDVQLIEDRLDHARVAAPAHAIDVLRPAVELIDGLPFAGTSYLWPDADGLVSNYTLLATTACAELAAHALALGDVELVFWSTQRGLGVLPGHEELIGLRMRAHARAGDLAGVRQEWESYERVITADAWSDGEPAPKLLDLRRTLLTG